MGGAAAGRALCAPSISTPESCPKHVCAGCVAAWPLLLSIPRPLAQVTKVSPTSTNARIMCCAGQALEADFTGVIRQQDVRSHEVDKVRLGFTDLCTVARVWHRPPLGGEHRHRPCWLLRFLALGLILRCALLQSTCRHTCSHTQPSLWCVQCRGCVSCCRPAAGCCVPTPTPLLLRL